MKQCKDCGVPKDETDFYPTQGECKICTRERVRKREYELMRNPELHEKEKQRQREKYYRLKYKNKHKPSPEIKKQAMARYKDRYPEKALAHKKQWKMKALVLGNELHHWSYNEEHWVDLIELPRRDHAKLHRYMYYDHESKMYLTIDGKLLDTKEKHIAYYESIMNLV